MFYVPSKYILDLKKPDFKAKEIVDRIVVWPAIIYVGILTSTNNSHSKGEKKNTLYIVC